VPQWIAPTIAAIAAVISLGSFVFSMGTYQVAQRPYVGVVKAPVNMGRNEKGEPLIQWTFYMQNTGNIPAYVTSENYLCQVKIGERSVSLPRDSQLRQQVIVMPKQEVEEQDKFSNESSNLANVNDVLSGKTPLTCDINLSYRTIGRWWGWWESTFSYKAVFRAKNNPLSFVMESGFAD
jgi:hypothetical protein